MRELLATQKKKERVTKACVIESVPGLIESIDEDNYKAEISFDDIRCVSGTA